MSRPATGRITQGQFSFLPDLTDAEIALQVDHGLARGYAWSVEHTDDPHPRNTFWEMHGMPMFDLRDAAGVVAELRECRRAFPDHYIRLMAFDSTRGIESIAMSFIVHRPAREAAYTLQREEVAGRSMRYVLQPAATTATAIATIATMPAGERG